MLDPKRAHSIDDLKKHSRSYLADQLLGPEPESESRQGQGHPSDLYNGHDYVQCVGQSLVQRRTLDKNQQDQASASTEGQGHGQGQGSPEMTLSTPIQASDDSTPPCFTGTHGDRGEAAII